ncbi:hypothetical protein C0Q70_14582 [Pomacea canaliculata]|uniref:C-type lectin domain-containing protein n=1 Tax=Pomacea canaliculata TaxID=400727 RepID=A0A2T7NSI7_POMCA|nr:hypothetical protein C0Q70_14582 [Pomacea canaliculata]
MLVTTVTVYSNAQLRCQQDGGHVMHYKSLTVDRPAVTSLLSNKTFRTTRLWVGGKDENKDGLFEWTDGEVIDQASGVWSTGEPSISPDESCVVLRPEYRMADQNCSKTHSYICQIDYGTRQLTTVITPPTVITHVVMVVMVSVTMLHHSDNGNRSTLNGELVSQGCFEHLRAQSGTGSNAVTPSTGYRQDEMPFNPQKSWEGGTNLVNCRHEEHSSTSRQNYFESHFVNDACSSDFFTWHRDEEMVPTVQQHYEPQ